MENLKRYRISIYSENPDKLSLFYLNCLKFKLNHKKEMPNDYGYVFDLSNDLQLFVAKHSEVTGNNQDSFRHIFDLQVPDVVSAFNNIKDYLGITIVASPYQAECSIVATFLDPEGNCWQLSE